MSFVMFWKKKPQMTSVSPPLALQAILTRQSTPLTSNDDRRDVMRREQRGVAVQVLERPPTQDPELRPPARPLAPACDTTLDRDVRQLRRRPIPTARKGRRRSSRIADLLRQGGAHRAPDRQSAV